MKHKKLMIVGPTEIEEDILRLGAEPQVYMRTTEFSARLEKTFRNLQEVFCTQNPVVFFACSGTGTLDAAVSNFTSRGEEVIVINGGSFGHRWVDICEHYHLQVHEIKVEFGKSVTPEAVKAAVQAHPKAVALFSTLDETSSGALTDVQAIGNILKDYPDMLFVVDAVSALLVEPLEMDAWGVDVVTSASQKAIAIPPGMGFMAVSAKAAARAEHADNRGAFFDILEHIKDWKRHQTPFTPAVSLIFQLERRLEKVMAEGLENYRARYRRLTEEVRAGLNELGFSTFAEHPANCVTAVWTEEYDATEIVRILSQKHHIEIAPSGGDIRTHIFRIGNFGDIDSTDIAELMQALRETLNELKAHDKR